MSLSKEQLDQVFEKYTETDSSGGRDFKVGIAGQDNDGAPSTSSKAIKVGGIAVDPAVPNTYAIDDSVTDQHDKDTGAKMILQGNLDPSLDGIASYSKPDATSTYTPSSDLSSAYESSSVSKLSAGVLYFCTGYNSGPAQWIEFYNSTTVPSDGSVSPVIVIRAAAASNFSLDLSKFGVYFSTGISWSNSTNASPFTKTIGASDVFMNVLFK